MTSNIKPSFSTAKKSSGSGRTAITNEPITAKNINLEPGIFLVRNNLKLANSIKKIEIKLINKKIHVTLITIFSYFLLTVYLTVLTISATISLCLLSVTIFALYMTTLSSKIDSVYFEPYIADNNKRS